MTMLKHPTIEPGGTFWFDPAAQINPAKIIHDIDVVDRKNGIPFGGQEGKIGAFGNIIA